MNVVRADAGDGVRLIVVHVDQALEVILLAAVEGPGDGPLLVDLQMVGIEVVQDINPSSFLGVPLPPKVPAKPARGMTVVSL